MEAEKGNVKRVLVLCAYHLDGAYRMCGLLVRLYPEQAPGVAEALSGALTFDVCR